MRNGSFVELGGLDGVTYSNTLMLDTCLQWRGALVEGSALNFRLLQRNVRKLRRHVTAHFGAVCAADKHFVSFVRGRGPVGGDVATMSPGFKKTWYGNAAPVTVNVPCKPMSDYIGAAGHHVDFFSLDIEGAEMAALSTIDFEKHTIDVFMIEMDDDTDERTAQIRSLLAGVGYTECPGAVPRSGLFVHSRRADFMAACRSSYKGTRTKK
ncbi:hypothetical protein T492DRAFT_621010 [Pavlovales sp. CCMP2436]|nr:hypothetical protein T492DRAFT_621010 [Pavlovales sp. CCMP2436]